MICWEIVEFPGVEGARQIPGLMPDAVCSKTNPSVILRGDDFNSRAALENTRSSFAQFDVLMSAPHNYMAAAARFKAAELIRLANALESTERSCPELDPVYRMRMAWLLGRIDRGLNLCWHDERNNRH
jgi:hypothetical protein